MTEEQDARAKLKQQFVHIVENFIDGMNATAQLYQNDTMECKFLALQGNGEHYIVENLQTPTGAIKTACLRTSDTQYISVPCKVDCDEYCDFLNTGDQAVVLESGDEKLASEIGDQAVVVPKLGDQIIVLKTGDQLSVPDANESEA